MAAARIGQSIVVHDGISYKGCGRCGLVQPLFESFHKSKNMSSGYDSCCKACSKQRRAAKTPLMGRALSGKPGQPPKAVIDGKQLCSVCKLWVATGQFSSSTRSTTGLSYRCKSCDANIFQEYKLTADIAKRGDVSKAWSRNNRAKVNVKKAIRHKARMKTDVNYRLSCTLRFRLSSALWQLNAKKPAASAVRDLGCTLTELRLHIETLFQPGMTWENHSMHGWHIDHIRPLASFDLTDAEQLKQAAHYTNLQPLWADDNLRKGSKYPVLNGS